MKLPLHFFQKREKRTQYKHGFIILFIIVLYLFSFAVRVWNIESVPPGITHDELDLILTAKMVTLRGTDLSGKWSPLSLKPPQTETQMSELDGLVHAPFVWKRPLSLYTGKIGMIVLLAAFPVVLGCFVYILFQNMWIGGTVGILTAMNPWAFQFSRTTFEAPLATLFLVCSMGMIITMYTSKKWMYPAIISILFFFLSFYMYHGIKLIAFPMALFTLFWMFFQHRDNKKRIKQTVFVVCGLLLVMLPVIIRGRSAYHRTSELIPFQLERHAKEVIIQRTRSLFSPLTNTLLNKYTFALREITDKYLFAFSPGLLFLSGETRGAYSLWYHGLMYVIDIPFIVLGFILLSKRKPKILVYLLGLLFLAPIPSALSTGESSYVFRSSFVVPLLLIFTGFGMYEFFVWMKKSKTFIVARILFLVFLLFIYSAHVGTYLYTYFLRYPVYNSEGFFFSERLANGYLQFTEPSDQILVYHKEPYGFLRSILFYQNMLKNETADEVRSLLSNGVAGTYQFRNYLITSSCENAAQYLQTNPNAIVLIQETMAKSCEPITVILQKDELDTKIQHKQIMDPGYAGVHFYIYHDRICQTPTLTYTRPTALKQFVLEKMSKEQFCSEWMARPL